MSALKSIIAKVGMDGTDFEVGAKAVEERAEHMGEHIAEEFKAALAGAFAVEGLKEAIHSAIEFGEEIKNTATRLGVTTTAAQELSFSAKQTGTDLEHVANGLDKLAKSMTAIEEGGASGEKMEHAFARLGISAEELKGKMPEEALKLVGEHLENMTITSDVTTSMLEIFGKSGSKLIPMLKELHENIEKVQDAGLVLGPETIEVLDNAHKSVDRVSLSLKVLAAEGLVGFKTLVTGAYDFAASVLTIHNRLDTISGNAHIAAMEKTLAIQKELKAIETAAGERHTVDETAQTDEQKKETSRETSRLNEDTAKRQAKRQENSGTLDQRIERAEKNQKELQTALDRFHGKDGGLAGADLRNQLEVGTDNLAKLREERLRASGKKNPEGSHHGHHGSVDALQRIGGSVGGAENVMVNLAREQLVAMRQIAHNTLPKAPDAIKKGDLDR